MKHFFEQYGGVALGILALLVLIAMITPVGNIIKTSLQGTTNKFSGSMYEQLDGAMNATASAQNSALGVISGGGGGAGGNGNSTPVDLTNVNVAGVVGDFSTKGNLVTVNGIQYRVLAVNGTQIKVMSMVDIGSSAFNDSSITASFGSTTGQKYAGSTLDIEMTNFYNSLPAELQNAIVEQNISQSMYRWTSGTNASANFSAWYANPFTDATTSGNNYYLTRIAEVNVGARKVFALDLDDAISYLGANSTAKDVNEMFFGVRNNVPRSVWLRSAGSISSSYAFCVYGYYGYLNYYGYRNSYEVRPAFVLDLSLLS